MISRLCATPGDIAACWRNTAKLQRAAGDAAAAKQTADNARMVSGINAWNRQYGRRP